MTEETQGVWLADTELRVLPVRGIPEVGDGDDLAGLTAAALERAGLGLRPHDVVVVTHKVVSKAEGRVVDLASVEPSALAVELGARTAQDPRQVEVVLGETARVLRADRALITETRSGLVCANAGVDRSNAAGPGLLTLLPLDADDSAAALRARWLPAAGGGPLGVIVSDTFGRPFRLHGVNVALGIAGMPAATSYTGVTDPAGYVLRRSELATADEIAAAAELVMGKLDGIPVAVVRGLRWEGDGRAADLLRDAASDLFRR